VTHHAEAAAVVDDDEIGAAFLDELGADAGAGAGGDDGVALGERRAKALDALPRGCRDFLYRSRDWAWRKSEE
jgi:hypothetical protein